MLFLESHEHRYTTILMSNVKCTVVLTLQMDDRFSGFLGMTFPGFLGLTFCVCFITFGNGCRTKDRNTQLLLSEKYLKLNGVCYTVVSITLENDGCQCEC